MSRGPDAATALARTLHASAERAGLHVIGTQSDMTRWASATFTGARHVLRFTAAASALLDQWLAALAEADLPIRGHLVADIVVTRLTRSGDRVTFEIEALTVEDR